MQVKMLHRRLKISDKMENDPTEKQTDTTEHLMFMDPCIVI